MAIEGIVYEAGNGFPEVGDHLTGQRDGEPYRIVRMGSSIRTNGPGAGNSVEVTVELADWDDFEGEPYEAHLRLESAEEG